MTKNLTVLNIFSTVYLVGCLIYLLLNWEILSKEEGWGVIGMLTLLFFGLIGYFLDFALRKLVKHRILMNLIGLIIVLLFGIELWISFKH